jgi:hypothetical protein
MNELAMLLDELVADAPVDKVSWNDVVARGRRIRRPRHSRQRLVLALAAAALVAFAGTAVGVGVNLLAQQERFHAEFPDDPQRLGPLVEVASGDEWALIAWQSKYGICLDFAIPGNSPFSCIFPVYGGKPAAEAAVVDPAIHAVAGFVSGGGLVGGDGKTSIFGVAAPEVTTVKVELRDGPIVDATLYDAPPELREERRFFIVRVSLAPHARVTKGLPLPYDGPVRAYYAYDGAGRLIERLEE